LRTTFVVLYNRRATPVVSPRGVSEAVVSSAKGSCLAFAEEKTRYAHGVMNCH
jgi:hypothetical protein